jgi:hypothetical protein
MGGTQWYSGAVQQRFYKYNYKQVAAHAGTVVLALLQKNGEGFMLTYPQKRAYVCCLRSYVAAEQ